jgi:hypothetical protein
MVFVLRVKNSFSFLCSSISSGHCSALCPQLSVRTPAPISSSPAARRARIFFLVFLAVREFSSRVQPARSLFVFAPVQRRANIFHAAFFSQVQALAVFLC